VRKTVGRRRYLSPYFVARAFALALLLWLGVTGGLVVLFRYATPPFTAVMVWQPGPLRDIDYDWVARGDIAAAAARAVMASEDQRFFEHHGIDFVSLDKALRDYREGDNLRGASTITQQVAKNLFLWQGRSFARKLLEAYFALLIEALWSKERILEVYLNVAEFGPSTYGVEAAAEKFFRGSAKTLTAPQAALLAAVLPNPARLSAARPSAYVRSRQAWILGQMRLLEARGHYRELDW
jgi:monofunctional biosynthetic peptidoglycan transglycosylase